MKTVDREIKITGGIYAPLRIAMLLCAMFMLGGCSLWDLANFQWQNANAKVDWANELQRTAVPFTMLNEHILVEVSVNHSEPLLFVLDSGAAATVITTTEKTHRLGLPKNKPLTISGSGDGDDPTAFIVPDTHIQLGDFSISALSVIYAPTAAMPFDSIEETYFDGVLGADFFNCCLVEINHDRKALVISKSNAANSDAYQHVPWQRLNIDVQGDTPYLSTRIVDSDGEKAVKVMLDTGSTGTLSLFSGDKHFVVPEKHYATNTRGVSGKTSNRVGALDSMSFGGKKFLRLPTYFRAEGSNPQDGSHGVLGNRVMQQFNLVFDFSGQQIWYQPRRQFNASIQADRSGLRLLPHSQGAIAKSIAPNTGADELNLPVNSIVTHIQDTRITDDNFDELNSALKSQTLDNVSICWQVRSEQTCGVLPLTTRI